MTKPRQHSSRTILALVICSAFIFHNNGAAQTKAQKIDELIRRCHDNGHFNGSALVAEKGQIIYNQAFGLANIKTKEKVQPITAFNLASVSKQFTAMAIMILQERGRLRYDDDLRKYLPALPYEGVTVRHLLTHTSGLPDYIELFDQHWDTTKAPDNKTIATNADIVTMLAQYHSAILFKPGERWEYSNTGYALLFSIVEKTSGESFEQFLHANIFSPLQMTRTLVYSKLKDQKIDHRAYGFRMSLDGKKFIPNDLIYLDGIAGDGGIYSTTEDLFKWDQALYTEKLVKPTMLQEAFTPVKLNDGSTYDYGFGWSLTNTDGKLTVHHTGGWAGFRTLIARAVSENNTLILLTNSTNAPRREMSLAISNILHDRPYELPRIPLAPTLGRTILRQGIAAAVAQYHDLKANQPRRYDFDEDELNGLGYELLELKKIKEAIAIFELNVAAFPQSANVYDSLGEACMAGGNKELSIKNYQKSLELNPQNSNASARLKRLNIKTE